MTASRFLSRVLNHGVEESIIGLDGVKAVADGDYGLEVFLEAFAHHRRVIRILRRVVALE